MRSSRWVVACVFLASHVATPARAKTWTDIDHPVRGPHARAALSFIRAHGDRFGAAPELRVQRLIPLRGGSVVRIAGAHRGRRVLNAGASVMILGERIIAVSGGLGPSRITGRFALDRKQAARALRRRIPGARIEGTQQGLWAKGGVLRPAWAFEVATDRPLGRFRVVLDAQEGGVLSSVSRLVRGWGQVYGTNPSVSGLKKVELKGLEKPDQLAGVYASVSSCKVKTSSITCQRHATPSRAGDFVFDPDEPSSEDPFSEVQAYHHADALHRWLTDRFGFVRKRASQRIDVMVNFTYASSSIANAFYGDITGDGLGEIVLGQGQKDFAYDADVVYHEFIHSAVDETSNLTVALDDLGFNLMPLALNEGFADLFSCIFAGDPNVGEYAGQGGAIRRLTGEASCPEDMMGESHRDGLLWGRAGWAVRSKVDKQAFDDVLYKTMVGLDSQAGFTDAVALFIKIAKGKDPSLAQIAQAEFSARGIDTCTRIVPLLEGERRRGYLMGTGSLGLSVVPGPFQLEVKVSETARRLELSMSSFGGAAVGCYVRKGEPVRFSGMKAIYDFVMPNNQPTFTLAHDDPKQRLEPGATYYVLPLNVGKNDAMFRTSYTLTRAQPLTPDASSSPDAGPTGDASDTDGGLAQDGSSGCSCRLGGGSAAPGAARPLLLLLLVLGWRGWRGRRP